MREFPLNHKKIAADRLIPFGFQQYGDGYRYSADLLNGQFTLELYVTREGGLRTRLVEKELNEEYTLHLVPDAAGGFVGAVRAAYQAALDQFIQSCCETDIFKSEQARRVIEYVRQTYGDELEYLWKKFPESAVFRRRDTRTWYGAILTVSRAKLGFDNDEVVEIIDLRMQPEQLARMIDGKRYLRGYHMNKENWFTMVLDGSVATEEIFSHIDDSYRIAAQRPSKRGNKRETGSGAHKI